MKTFKAEDYNVKMCYKTDRTPVAILWDDLSYLNDKNATYRRQTYRSTIEEAIEHVLNNKYDPRMHQMLHVEWDDGTTSWCTPRWYEDGRQVHFCSCSGYSMFTATNKNYEGRWAAWNMWYKYCSSI